MIFSTANESREIKIIHARVNRKSTIIVMIVNTFVAITAVSYIVVPLLKIIKSYITGREHNFDLAFKAS